MKRNNINNSARTEPERGRQLTITTFASELILEFSVSPMGIGYIFPDCKGGTNR